MFIFFFLATISALVIIAAIKRKPTATQPKNTQEPYNCCLEIAKLNDRIKKLENKLYYM